MARRLLALLACAALALPLAASDSVRVRVRVHHKHAAETRAETSRRVFRVTGPKAAFDELLTPAVQKELKLDVWRVRRADGEKTGELLAEIAATEDAIEKLRAKLSPGKKHRAKGAHLAAKLHVKTTEDNVLELRVAQDRKEVASCLYATKGYQLTLSEQPSYAQSQYFDCFRPYDQIFEFFDMVAEEHPEFVTKIHNISTTYEGRSIHAYKLSTPTKKATQTKKALYTQSLMHAREWQAGASTHFAFASLLDGLRQNDTKTLEIFDAVDWYFVPIVNVDGYKYSWEVDRYWRVNRHPSNGYEGVDLNRNFPPAEYFNVDPDDVSEETNPGEAPLSEPESRGIFEFILGIPNLVGFVDVHAYSGMVLRPFSDVQGAPEEPYGSAMKRLGDSVRDAMSPKKKGQFQYLSQTSGELYPAYGCIDDGVYRETNYEVPTLTIEVEGDDFIAPQKMIRHVGHDLDCGLRRFVAEALKYNSFILKLKKTN